ncbi:MAG TPA: MoxR family ATPase [Bryobacteraceae bacterium]|nr:MoxR family ATPase [Bryobacteraceae bacterium]
MEENFEQLKAVLERTRAEVRKVVIGQEAAIDYALVCIFTGNHALVEGVPGVAKTLLTRTLAHVLGGAFNRVQFTPDLMPTDITGTSVFNLQRGEFTLVRGPIFTTFLLADEINRAPARTQAALLEAMQERTVTIDRETHPLPPAFTVFATQNPIEYEGTYPLPEAQKDRFMLKIPMPLPERDEEAELGRRMLTGDAPEDTLAHGNVEPVLQGDELPTVRRALARVTFREELADYAVDVVRRTRTHEAILSGAGPRGTQSLLMASRAHAAIQGRDFVTPDDIRALTVPVLAHRQVLRPEFELEGLTSAEVLQQILAEIPVPR